MMGLESVNIINGVVQGIYSLDGVCVINGVAQAEGYLAETLAYSDRVTADGGTVVSLDDIDDALRHMSSLGLSPYAWFSSQFGYKDAGSDKVSKLYDLTTNNRDATQTTSGKEPVWTADQQNGKAGLVFTAASSQFFVWNTLATMITGNDKPHSIFYVRKVSNGGAPWACGWSGSSNGRFFVTIGAGFWWYRKDDSGGSKTSSGGTNSADMCVESNVMTGTAMSIWVDGTIQVNAADVNVGNVSLNIGRIGCHKYYTYPEDTFINGTVCEMIFFNSALSTANREALEAKMKLRWGTP